MIHVMSELDMDSKSSVNYNRRYIKSYIFLSNQRVHHNIFYAKIPISLTRKICFIKKLVQI